MLFRAQLTHQALLLLNPPTPPSCPASKPLHTDHLQNTKYSCLNVRLDFQRVDLTIYLSESVIFKVDAIQIFQTHTNRNIYLPH